MSLSAAVHKRLDYVLRSFEDILSGAGLKVTATALAVDPESSGYDEPKTFPVTILTGAALSDALTVPSPMPIGWAVEFPNAWTAANLGLDGSDDGTNWVPIRDEYGNLVKITGIVINAVASYRFPISEAMQAGAFTYLRLTSLDKTDNSAEAQAGDRVLKVRAFC